MKKVIFLLGLALSGQATLASAAIPIFQLAPRTIDTSHLTQSVSSVTTQNLTTIARAGSPNITRIRFEKSALGSRRTSDSSSAPAPHVVFAALAQSHGIWPHIDAATRNSGLAIGGSEVHEKTVSSVSAVDDSLYYFLRNFKRQPPPKPASWTLLLVGLCLTLYQIRRRPMRASIGVYPTQIIAAV